MPSARFPILQGTLDMLILQILALEPTCHRERRAARLTEAVQMILHEGA